MITACSRSPNGSRVDEEVMSPGTSASSLEEEKPDKTKYLITDTTVGPFRLGGNLPGPATMMKYKMRVEQIARHTEEGPVKESVTIIAEEHEDLLWLKPGLLSGSPDNNNRIDEIIVLSPKYQSREKIGPGSTIFDFMKAYPDYRVWYTYVSDMYVIESDSINAQFILDQDDYTGPEFEFESEITPLLTSDFNKNGKIRRVRLFQINP